MFTVCSPTNIKTSAASSIEVIVMKFLLAKGNRTQEYTCVLHWIQCLISYAASGVAFSEVCSVWMKTFVDVFQFSYVRWSKFLESFFLVKQAP